MRRATANSSRLAFSVVTLGLLVGCGVGGGGQADVDYPSKDIEFIVPYDPGGGYDAWARLLAPFIEEHLPNRVNVVVRNVPGADGQIAANQLYVAEPDGTRIDIVNLNGLAAARLAGEGDFDLKGFTCLGRVATDPQVLSVSGNSGVKTVEELKGAAPVKMGVTGLTSAGG